MKAIAHTCVIFFVLLQLIVGVRQLFAQEDEPFGAEGAADEGHEIHIPEPMVFDLVRGLGAHRGEFETNVLALIPLDRAGDRPVEWAPEVEYAVFDGFALEFELGFEDTHLEAYKLAAQYTFGTAFDHHFIHGTQGIIERFDGLDLWEFSLLYVPGIRFDRTWSLLAMIGVRTESGSDSENHTELLFNLAVFADLSHNLSVGVESNVASEADGHTETLLWPQLHWEINDYFMLQLGAGAEFRAGETDTTFAFRFIYSR